MPNIEIVAIGSELLLGQIVDTNSAWMAERLTGLGVNLFYKSVVGDNPGRKEPGTGGINFSDLFQRIAQRGYAGILGMDHGNSMPGKAGEQAVIDAYARHDRLR